MTAEHPAARRAVNPSSELSLLSRQQYEALQRAPYRRMSRAEQEEYDRRRMRIAELSGTLESPIPPNDVAGLTRFS